MAVDAGLAGQQVKKQVRPPRLGDSMAEQFSERERDILRLLAEGQTNREIAARLVLSPETVKWYNKQLFARLGAANRSQAVARAQEMGMLDGRDRAPAESPVPGSTRLPAPLSSFIGRQRELAEVIDLLKEARLVTITGPGGSGKTRLGLRLAEAVAGHYAHGVTFVDLAAISDPDRVAAAIGHELGLAEQPNQPPVAGPLRFLANKEMLLLLDNFEHLLPAAPLVAELLAAAPRLAVLATSRERLRLSGEHEYPLQPLSVPAAGRPLPAADLAALDAVALFAQRAQAAAPDFRLTDDNAPAVAAICRRLDGLPLAIELAAARSKLFNPQQLLSRLDDRLAILTGGPRDAPARQQTLRDTIDWSYRLLDPAEQRFFARLAVFTGGRSIEAAAAVAGPGLALDALDGLASLLDKNLLTQQEGPGGEPRFYMLETIHEFAWLKLAESGDEPAARDRHLAYFLALAEAMEEGYTGPGQLLRLAQTEAEEHNLRAAFDWALAGSDFETAARLVSALYYFHFYWSNPAGGYRQLQQLLPHVDRLSAPVRGKTLRATSRLAYLNRESAAAQALCRQALALARQTGDRLAEAWSLAFLVTCQDTGRPELFDELWAMTDQALAGFRLLDHKPGQAFVLNLQGENARVAGDRALARQKYEASMALCRETGDHYRELVNLANLVTVTYDEGDYQESLALGRQVMQRLAAINNHQGLAQILAFLGGPLAQLGQPQKAARLLAASDLHCAELGGPQDPVDQAQIDRYVAETCRLLGEETFAAAWAEGQAMTLDQALTYALEE
jgi:predicted ATPase/DNA-binding CsgD family transcriptional regulator